MQGLADRATPREECKYRSERQMRSFLAAMVAPSHRATNRLEGHCYRYSSNVGPDGWQHGDVLARFKLRTETSAILTHSGATYDVSKSRSGYYVTEPVRVAPQPTGPDQPCPRVGCHPNLAAIVLVDHRSKNKRIRSVA